MSRVMYWSCVLVIWIIFISCAANHLEQVVVCTAVIR